LEPGLSIQIAWPLAAKEAIDSEHEFIEPPHLFLAVLKFSELERRHIEQIETNPMVIAALLSERDGTRKRLQELSIEIPDKSRSIRYNLRKRLGRKGHPFHGNQVIHRSNASRQLCVKAEDMARKEGSATWCALNLLEALLASNSLEITEVLADAGISGIRAFMNTPHLDRYGQDLSALAMEKQKDNIEGSEAKDPVCKVVADDIYGGKKGSILLIQKGKRSSSEVAEGVAVYSVGKFSPPGAKTKRLIAIDIPGDIKLEELESTLGTLLQEASRAGNIILYIDRFHDYLKTGPGLPGLIKRMLSEGKIQLICGTAEEAYHHYIEKDPAWKRLLRPVWIHDLNGTLRL
jgi:ATP-dependent Clp protease ATP-binding subunit ClpA